MPRGDHTLKDSQQSVVHHERAPTRELETGQVSRSAPCRAKKTARHFHFDYLLLPKFEGIVLLPSSAGIASVGKFPKTVEAMSISKSTTALAGVVDGALHHKGRVLPLDGGIGDHGKVLLKFSFTTSPLP